MKTIIWDYNGTIIDDLDIAVKAENIMLERRGLKAGYTREDYRDLFSLPMENYYRSIGYTFEEESFTDIAHEFMALYQAMFEECGLCRGVKEKLEESVAKGYQNVILSSCEHTILNEQCRKLGIDGYFREIMGIDNLLAGSKVEIGKHWMIRSGVRPDECIYLGDTSADYDTAEAIGVGNIILVASGHQSYERLKQLHPNTVHDVTEVKL